VSTRPTGVSHVNVPSEKGQRGGVVGRGGGKGRREERRDGKGVEENCAMLWVAKSRGTGTMSGITQEGCRGKTWEKRNNCGGVRGGM